MRELEWSEFGFQTARNVANSCTFISCEIEIWKPWTWEAFHAL